MHSANSSFLLAPIDQTLFHEPEPVKIEITSRQEDKTHIPGTTDRLQRKFLLCLLFRMAKFDNLCNFFLFRGKPDLDHILFHRCVTADHDAGGSLLSHIHVRVFQRYVIADLSYPVFLPAEAVPIKVIALNCQKLFIRLLQPGKRKSFQMDLGMKDKTDTGDPFQPLGLRLIGIPD